MYSAVGRTVKWQGTEHKVIGMAPASRVGLGDGYAALILIGGTSKYINTRELELINS